MKLKPRLRPQIRPQPGDSWRTTNARAQDKEAFDLWPTCPRCGDLCIPYSKVCVECGVRLGV